MNSQIGIKLSDEDTKKYAQSGMNFYGMMNFDDLENPQSDNIQYIKKLLLHTCTPHAIHATHAHAHATPCNQAK